ncbi:MAG TPA: phosphoribosyltransferase family protein [Candidatus Acidoferrum sp.]|nr:phosphoribosyltransferase family protein [Candidatus Acidoferrum sp.]
MQFESRKKAGHRLGQELLHYRGQEALVVGLARGGVPVAFEVAEMLGAPIDVWVARKCAAPGLREVGMAAIAEGPAFEVNRQVVERLQLSARDVSDTLLREADQIDRRARRLRAGRTPPDVRGRIVILVDDGIASGATARAAIKALHTRGARRLVLAVPVAPPAVIERLRPLVDEVICLAQPVEFTTIAASYDDFHTVSDAEVMDLLELASVRLGVARSPLTLPPSS